MYAVGLGYLAGAGIGRCPLSQPAPSHDAPVDTLAGRKVRVAPAPVSQNPLNRAGCAVAMEWNMGE